MHVDENIRFSSWNGTDLISLSARARAIQATVSAPMGRVLQLILDRPETITSLDARVVAEETQTSTATVVRTARKLGFDGYRELRLALTALTAADRSPGNSDKVIGDIDTQDSVSAMLSKLARDEQDTLHATASLVDPDAVSELADRIVAARSVHVFGVVASGLVAVDFSGKLNRIGIRAIAHTEAHEALTASTLLEAGDLAFGISSSGSTVDVLDALSQARNNGAFTVAMTTDPASPIARACELVLVSVVGRESEIRPAALSSRISQLFLVDAVFIRVVQLTYDRSRLRMHATHEAILGRRKRSSLTSTSADHPVIASPSTTNKAGGKVK